MNPSAVEPSTLAGSRSRRRAQWWVVVALVAAFTLWGWFDVRNRGAVDPNQSWVHKTDFTVYTEAGAAFFDGRDPYSVTNPRGWGYLYPPLFAILLAPLHAFDPRNQVFLWFAVNAILGWGCLRELVRIARQVLPNRPSLGMFGPMPCWIGAAAVSAAMLPALNCMQRGQVGILKMYLLLLGFRLLVASRGAVGALLAGWVLALPIALKITPAVPVAIALGQQWTAAWYAKTRGPWARTGAFSLGTAGGLAACLLLLPALAVGWRANLHHLDTWWNVVALRAESVTADDFAGDSTSFRNQSLVNAAHSLGNWSHYYFAGGPHDRGPNQLRRGGPGLLMDAPAVWRALLAARLLAACLVVAVGFRMGRDGDRLGQAAAFGLACAATLIIFPIARTHYYVLLLPAVAFVSTWCVAQRRARQAVALAIVPSVLVIGHYVSLDVAGRGGLLGLGTTLWYLTSCGTMLWPGQTAASRDAAFPSVTSRGQAEQRPIAA